MNRDHKFRSCLRHCFCKESFFHIAVRLCQAGDTEKQYISVYAVQLPLYVIEAGSDQDLLLSVLYIEIVLAALLVFP